MAKRFCYECLPSGIFQWVKGLQDSIIRIVSLLVAIMKDQVLASFEEQMFSHGMAIVVLYCIYKLSHCHTIRNPNIAELITFWWDSS